MPDTLKSIVEFIDVPALGTASKPHNLTILGGREEVPDHVEVDNGAFSVTADETTVTVTNKAKVAASVNVLCERWHSTPRAFGARGQDSLQPRPYIPASGPGEAAEDQPVPTTDLTRVGVAEFIGQIGLLRAEIADAQERSDELECRLTNEVALLRSKIRNLEEEIIRNG